MLFIFFVVLIPIAVWLILHFISRREADDEARPKVPDGGVRALPKRIPDETAA